MVFFGKYTVWYHFILYYVELYVIVLIGFLLQNTSVCIWLYVAKLYFIVWCIVNYVIILFKNCIKIVFCIVIGKCSIFKSNPIYCINLLYSVIWDHIAICCITLYCDTIWKSKVFSILFYITSVSCIFVYCNISYIWYIIFYCYCSTKSVNRFTILQYVQYYFPDVL